MPNVKVKLSVRQLLPLGVIILCGVFTIGTVIAQIATVSKPLPRAVVMRAELDQIALDRRGRLVELHAASQGCAPDAAHEYAKLLVMDGRWDDARIYAHDYQARCGEDPEVHRWGNAPRPKPRVSPRP